MRSNFEFLKNDFPLLYKLGNISEKYIYSDPNSCIIKLGMFAETVVNKMMVLDGIEPPALIKDNTHANRIKILTREGMLPDEVNRILESIRKKRNIAVHSNYENQQACKNLIEITYKLAKWFMEVYGDINTVIPDFVMPEETSDSDFKLEKEEYDAKLADKEKEIEQLLKQIKEVEIKKLSEFERRNREKRRTISTNSLDLTEAQTREIIDAQLRKSGWEADTINLRYSKGTRPQKGKNIAIAEWPVIKNNKKGHVDYALFVDTTMVGIIEAKKFKDDIYSIIDTQGKEYAQNVQDKFEYTDKVAESDFTYKIGGAKNTYSLSNWNGYKVPFVFVTNGRKYLQQLETKSGIWFLDVRDNSNIPKVLKDWVSPEGIMHWLKRDIEQSNKNLENTNYDLLRASDGLNLRYYQIDAISSAEKAIVNGAENVLVAMATGTGKTRTVLGMIYRFLKTNRFNRILFLVDRTALGQQAQDVFNEVKLEDLLTLNDIYNIKSLDDREIDKETKIHIATVQSLVKRIMYSPVDEDEKSIISVSDYDLIIVDEAHRGYTLDKELDEDELEYRNQDDFISKYKMVIEYFDAVKIALTATPALHTTEIFGKPVYSYSYRDAVIDGYLVDHDAPHNIKTKLSTEGIKYKKGETVAIYDPITGQITNSDELEDEISFDIEQFNRRVITEEFNKAVLEEIADNIDPEGEGKTLIFAVDDTHAELIVKILRNIFSEQGIDQDAIMKITGKIGDKKRVLEAIRKFKNEKFPSVVVTVDLLTTGIDVPEITTLVFMRRVKSRILFEQMLGRATRLCDKINKSHFEIYDPVGVYESLQEVSTMKPIVVNVSTQLEDLIDGLDLPTEEQVKNQINLIVTKLRRKEKNITQKQLENFKALSGGMTPKELIEKIRKSSPEEAREIINNNFDLIMEIDQAKRKINSSIVISDKEDEVISHTRDFGNTVKPQEYLEEFTKFINENKEKIQALKIVCTRPSSLTRKDLKSLVAILDSNGYTQTKLDTAYKEAKNEDITADIITHIRTQALGSKMINHDDRIKEAVKKLKQNHKFSKTEERWLENIEKNLLTETIITKEDLNQGIFKSNGGFEKINKIFKNNLEEYINELNKYLYDDGGYVA